MAIMCVVNKCTLAMSQSKTF